MSNGEDADADGRTIAIHGRSYARGLGMHADADARFDLGGRYATFTADVGVDDETNGGGSVVFQVVVDGATVFDSGLVRGGEDARHVSVSVAGADELRLVVTNGGDGFGLDHADWAGAQLTVP
jgi:hypothetical protein